MRGSFEANIYKLFMLVMWFFILVKLFVQTKLDGMFIFVMAITGVLIMIGVHIRLTKKEQKYYKEYIDVDYRLDDNFKKVYNELLIKHLRELETLRKKIKPETYILGVMFFISLAISGYNMVLGIICIVATMAMGIHVHGMYDKYLMIYKKDVIGTLVKEIDANLEYSKNYNVYETEAHYRDAMFLGNDFSYLKSDDCISGTIDNGFLILSDVVLKMSGNANNYENNTCYEGCFVRIHSKVNSNLYLRINRNIEKLYSSNKFRVEMDSTEFEKYFDVFTNDKIETMRILTHDIMDEIIDFARYGIPFEIVIKDDNIYIKFNTGPMFEPYFNHDSMEPNLLYMYYCIVYFVIAVSKKIDNVLKDYIP